MDYREFPPSAALVHIVDRVWTLTGRADDLDEASQPILPDGRPELVMHFGDPFERVSAGGNVAPQAATLFAGQITEQLTLKPTGLVAVLGIRFHPYGAAPVLGVPQHQLTGLTVGVDDVSPGLARALQRVREQTDDVHAAVPLLQVVLERWVGRRVADPRLRFAAKTIVESQGAVSIDRLADQLSMTRRHLERLFLDDVGMGPKRLARITRFQRALRVLEASDPRRRGAITAATCGYADQSHFIREFRQLAGCSPAEHLVRQGEITGFFVSGSTVRRGRL